MRKTSLALLCQVVRDASTACQNRFMFWVFAPTDTAFKKLGSTVDELLKPENKYKLTAILTYHVVPGKVTSKDVVKLSEAKTVQGSSVAFKFLDGQVMVDEAKVVKADIMCNKGVIHVVDAVITQQCLEVTSLAQLPH